jgi:hypothetical protein
VRDTGPLTLEGLDTVAVLGEASLERVGLAAKVSLALVVDLSLS